MWAGKPYGSQQAVSVFLANLDPLMAAVAIVLGIYPVALVWLRGVLDRISDREDEE